MRMLKNPAEFTFQDDLNELIAILDTIPYGVLLVQMDHTIYFANKHARKLIGKKKMAGCHCKEIFCMDHDTDCPMEKTGTKRIDRKSMRHKDGKVFPVLKTVQPVVINKVRYYLEIVTDITNQVNIENELLEKTASLEKIIREKEIAEETASYEAIKFETLFEEVGDALFVHDMEGNVLKVNQKACDRLGYTREQFSKMKISDIDTPGSRPHSMERMNSIRANKKLRFKATHVTKEGDPIPVEIFSKLTLFDGQEAILSSARNITKQLNYERELIEARRIAEEKEEMISRMLNNIPSAVFTFDNRGKILQMNTEGISLFKIGQDLTGDHFFGDLIKCINSGKEQEFCGRSGECQNCELKSSIEKTLVQHQLVNKKEISLVIDTGNNIEEKTFLFSTAILNQHGDKTFLGYLEDITERKKIEVDLTYAKEKAMESDRLKSHFLNNISHEIRTPLNGIVGFLDIFEQNNLSAEDRKKFIDIMRKSSERLIETVNAIIDISKFETSSPQLKEEKFVLYDALERVIFETNAKYTNPGVEFSWSIDDELKNHIIETDWQKLLLIIHHLVSNAFKFTSSGIVHLSASRKGKDFDLIVEDSGPGIHEDDLQEIFKPFWKSEESVKKAVEGNGLGLTMALKLAHLMGGDIEVRSQVGKGSAFRFTLPGIFEDTPQEEIGILDIQLLQHKTILIAEDDVNNFVYLEAVLTTKGCNVIHAMNGAQALEYVINRNNIDLVLMDLRMPVMDGLTATREIRKINGKLPVIAHSAFVLNNEKTKALEAGCNDYLPKPVKRDELLAAMLKHISVKREEKTRSA